MIFIKKEKEIEILREGGHRLAYVLDEVSKKAIPGAETIELNLYAEKLIREMGDEPAFLNYKPAGARYPYPASLCVSINEEVVHGIPKMGQFLKDGDVVSLDLGLKHKGMFTDHAVTVAVGNVSSELRKLLQTTKEALQIGIKASLGGNKIGDIGYAIETFVKPHSYGIVDILSGHGVGKYIHEDPYVPNFGKKGTGIKLVPGMVIAIEPMLNIGTKEVVLAKDGYTFYTKDRKPSAHFEHTILITEGKPEILTSLK